MKVVTVLAICFTIVYFFFFHRKSRIEKTSSAENQSEQAETSSGRNSPDLSSGSSSDEEKSQTSAKTPSVMSVLSDEDSDRYDNARENCPKTDLAFGFCCLTKRMPSFYCDT